MYYAYQRNERLADGQLDPVRNPTPLATRNGLTQQDFTSRGVSAIELPEGAAVDHECIDNDQRVHDEVVQGVLAALEARRNQIVAAAP